jgi:hypothetical protein
MAHDKMRNNLVLLRILDGQRLLTAVTMKTDFTPKTSAELKTQCPNACGLAAFEHFVRAFRRETGSTPGVYRKLRHINML